MRLALKQFVTRAIMFKISTIDTPSKRRLVVEGMLTEPWVTELRIAWKNAARELSDRKLVIDLGSVTVISRDGEDAIFELMNEGAKFSCEGVFTRHLLTRLSRICHHRPHATSSKQDE
jgi:hypothetical protein